MYLVRVEAKSREALDWACASIVVRWYVLAGYIGKLYIISSVLFCWTGSKQQPLSQFTAVGICSCRDTLSV